MLVNIKLVTLILSAVGAASAAASPAPADSDLGARSGETQPHPFNPPLSVLKYGATGSTKRDAMPSVPQGHRRATNAERFARGLGPISPRKLWSRSLSARDSSPSSLPPTIPLPPPSGSAYVIRVLKDGAPDTDAPMYIGKDYNSYGQFGLTSVRESALQFAMEYYTEASSPPVYSVGLKLQNPSRPDIYGDFTDLAGIQGFSSNSPNILAGSSNYLTLGGSGPTPLGALPTEQPNSFTHVTSISKNLETVIWVYDGRTNNIHPRWLNTGGALKFPVITYYSKDNALAMTGDANAWSAMFGVSPVSTYKFYMETIPL